MATKTANRDLFEVSDSLRLNREEGEYTPDLHNEQASYRQDLGRRFQALADVIEETLVDNNALGLASRTNAEDDIEAREEFGFEQMATKQVAFQNQLEEWINEGILEPVSGGGVEEGEHYTAFYANAAYAEGISYADALLAERGADLTQEEAVSIMSRPIHVNELETLYTRNYQNLQDITEDLDQSISQILTQSLIDGLGTDETANRIYNEIEQIQHTRARVLARTELLNAHNRASIQRYGEFGVEQVEILVHTPCEICRPIHLNDPYPINEIPQGGPPFHPNCVCTVAPVV